MKRKVLSFSVPTDKVGATINFLMENKVSYEDTIEIQKLFSVDYFIISISTFKKEKYQELIEVIRDSIRSSLKGE